MKNKKIGQLIMPLLVACLFRLPALASADLPNGATRATTIQATYYVSPSGSDSNPGTLALPFATLQKATDVVKTISGSMTGDIIVYLRGGTYTLSGTLILDQSSSGTNGYNIKYMSYPGETPVISGGQAVTGWTVYDATKNIYKATGVNFDFRQLYVNGTKAIRARIPNKGTWDSVINFSRANKWITIHKSEIAAWNNFTKVEMAVQNWWTESYLRLSSYTTDTSNAYIKLHTEEDTVIFKRPYPGGLGDPIFGGAAYYFENAYEFIDAEGEWYRDADANTLYYKPRAGEVMSSATVIAPKIDTLVSLRGTLDNPVHNIWFYGISFMYSNWTRPSNYGQIDAQAFQYNVYADMNNVQKVGHPPAAVTVVAAHDIRIERNIFRFLGAIGLDCFYGTHDDVVTGNVFQNIAGGGISAGKFVQDSTVDNHVPYNPTDQREIVTNETISDNYLTSVAEDYWGAVPVTAGYPRGLRIEHNEVDGSLYTGISVGYGWTPADNAMSGNLIRYNYVHDYMQLLSDGGGIYTLSKQPGTSIDENYIAKGSPPLEQGALYFDNGSSNMFARANVIRNVNRYVYLDGTDKYNITMDNNYSDVTNYIFAGTGCSLTNMHIQADNNWALQAQDVINNAGLQPAYRNIRWITAAPAYRVSTNKIVTGTSFGASPSYAPGTEYDKAFDGNTYSYYDYSAANGGYAGIDAGNGNGRALSSIRFKPRDNLGIGMTGGKFQGSRTGATCDFSDLYTIPAQPADYFYTTAPVSDTGAYRYLRYLGPDGSYGDVAEIGFYTTVGNSRLSGTLFGTTPAFATGTDFRSATDGNVTSYFDDSAANGAYAGIDLGPGNAQPVTKISYYPRVGLESRMVGGKFQGSNTSTSNSYTDLFTIVDTPSGWVNVPIVNTTSYRYLRYLGPDGSYGDIGEMVFYSDSVDLSQGMTTSSSTIYGTGYEASKGVDGIINDGWSPQAETTDTLPWWQVDLGAGHTIKKIEVIARQDLDQPATRQNFEVRASNSAGFSTYTVLGSQGNSSFPHKGVWSQDVSNTGSFRYIRIAKSVSHEYFFISECRVYGL